MLSGVKLAARVLVQLGATAALPRRSHSASISAASAAWLAIEVVTVVARRALAEQARCAHRRHADERDDDEDQQHDHEGHAALAGGGRGRAG